MESRESSSDEEGKEVSAAAASLERVSLTEPQPQTQPSTLSYRKSLRLSSDQIVSLLYLHCFPDMSEAIFQLVEIAKMLRFVCHSFINPIH